MLLLKNNASFYYCKRLDVEILLLIHDSERADFDLLIGGDEPLTEQEATALISKGVMLQCHANAIVPIKGVVINATCESK